MVPEVDRQLGEFIKTPNLPDRPTAIKADLDQ
jgi:hypothetical protein